ncbi:hypothetical protein GBAR_LOCUS24155 [Geodia barretti]|uniref:Uncharacterized protein n=1 Tax=Geodia barretti TaxID=519541 RepID=A0AA35T956_GEOBA|nr:hypothetical protein GBAR_LOCUS24155 [Geodia barretti]
MMTVIIFLLALCGMLFVSPSVAGDELLASYTYLKREQIIDKDGYRIRATNATMVAEIHTVCDIENCTSDPVRRSVR